MKICPKCKTSHSKKGIFCSMICANKSKDLSGNGGYRAGSGRSKSGYYKGIYCGSTYELCWVIYNLDHDIKFTRFDILLERDGIKYLPDFLLDDNKTIIEIKGYELEDSVEKKTKVAESFGYVVLVLRKENLQHIFDYVSTKYNTKNYQILYAGYKPKYEYICNHCNVKFYRDRKNKSVITFCSRLCAGKGHRGVGNILGLNQYSKF